MLNALEVALTSWKPAWCKGIMFAPSLTGTHSSRLSAPLARRVRAGSYAEYMAALGFDPRTAFRYLIFAIILILGLSTLLWGPVSMDQVALYKHSWTRWTLIEQFL